VVGAILVRGDLEAALLLVALLKKRIFIVLFQPHSS
jgi:hypothetical protein